MKKCGSGLMSGKLLFSLKYKKYLPFNRQPTTDNHYKPINYSPMKKIDPTALTPNGAPPFFFHP
jgi:hypothetical protein